MLWTLWRDFEANLETFLNFSFYMGFHGLVASGSVVRLVCGAPRRLRRLLPSVLSLLIRREDPRLVVGPERGC